MNKTAITTILEAAACPVWCFDRDEPDHLTVWPNGDWDVTHLGEPVTVQIREGIPEGLPDRFVLRLQSFVCNATEDSYPCLVSLIFGTGRDESDHVVMTADHSRRLAEVLVQQADALTAATTASATAVAR